jgi:preprotein translocase subunit SecY
MKKGFFVTMLLFLFMALCSIVSWGYTYGVYYASFADQDTALVIMNSGGGLAGIR